MWGKIGDGVGPQTACPGEGVLAQGDMSSLVGQPPAQLLGDSLPPGDPSDHPPLQLRHPGARKWRWELTSGAPVLQLELVLCPVPWSMQWALTPRACPVEPVCARHCVASVLEMDQLGGVCGTQEAECVS